MSSISAAIQRSLFKDKDGGGGAGALTAIIKHRFLSFLIWQSLQSTLLLFLAKTLLLSLFTKNPFSSIFQSLVYFVSFHFSLLVFSVSLFFVSSPHPLPFASPFEISLSFIRLIFVSGGEQSLLRRRIRVSLSFVLFVCLCAVAGAVSVISVCWGSDVYYDVDSRSSRAGVLRNLGFRGFVIGLLYGLHYVYKQRWVFRFPIIQRPPFFSYKMGLPLSIGQALRFSAVGYVLSGVLAFFLPIEYRGQSSVGKFIVEQIVFYLGSFIVILCWELSHHLHQVLHTKRYVFAPPKGSAAAETNPSEPLLATIEESTPNSLLQYLAYLDLCMLCENNVDTWRRAAFFEETGETYKRVIAACLRPLEQFTQKLAEGLESSSAEKSMQLSDQLTSPTERLAVLKLYGSFFDAQLCAWCARVIASLTSRSRKEDKFGVAQLSGSNAAAISTLLSSLLAVETLMGKKNNVQSAHLMGPAGIKWATVNTGRRESTSGAMGKIRGSPLYAKAYSMADILKTSIYCIVSAFHNEMLNSGKAGLLEKDWIISSKPLYGTHELLLHKLRLFLDYQAS
ncbi:nucleoporin protein Ndc1-Nup protein [Perilla frutescens var. hirtella]|uniref:Nucleoporin protein Ndc1-Nup protein n=1 Tax=Perilla frutescens var. hirtella TaxID=608512 RepID=A0AAD4JEA7_PERFH|nr:nucleoporin protein Ndc1-Nup protein [Perilla frutescens var. frutescens]KAH6832246.1 nucleoporin protein Ndc1-Nup protein [Perilla frutescens var. hirtella]